MKCWQCHCTRGAPVGQRTRIHNVIAILEATELLGRIMCVLSLLAVDLALCLMHLSISSVGAACTISYHGIDVM